MNDLDRYQLLYGPYQAPRCRLGAKLLCEIRGWVPVRRISTGRIPWPQTLVRNNPAFILRIGHRPPDGARLWTAEEEALLGTMPDAEVARRIGRTVGAVRSRRGILRIPSTSGKGPPMRDPKPSPAAVGV
jgi:hypothetical protein